MSETERVMRRYSAVHGYSIAAFQVRQEMDSVVPCINDWEQPHRIIGIGTLAEMRLQSGTEFWASRFYPWIYHVRLEQASGARTEVPQESDPVLVGA